MTADDLVAIVCECLADVGVMPDEGEEECADLAPDDLDLDAAAITQLLACVITKVKQAGQTVVAGKTM